MVTSVGCTVPTVASDANAPDAGDDAHAEVQYCEPAAELVMAGTLDPSPVREPGIHLCGLVAKEDHFVVAAFRFTDDFGFRGEYVLSRFSLSGSIVESVIAHPSAEAAGCALSASPTGVVLATIDFDQLGTSVIEVNGWDGGATVETLSRIGILDPTGAIESPALSTQGDVSTLWYLQGGALMSFLVERPPTPREVVPAWAAPTSHLAAIALDDARTCLVVRERDVGRLRVATATATGVTDDRTLVEYGALTTPSPAVHEGACALAYFDPSQTNPRAGVVRNTVTDDVLYGWGGIAPAAAQWSAMGVAIAFWADDATGAGVAWVRADANECRPVATVGPWPITLRASPFGDLLVAANGTNALVVTTNLTEPGRLTAFAVSP